MTFNLEFSPEAKAQIKHLKSSADLQKQFKVVSKALNYLKTNPRHPGLNIHPFEGVRGPFGQKLWEAYAENDTPGAYRIFFTYGPERQMISIISVVPHPD